MKALGSNKRMALMLPVLALAAYLAVFADKTPQGGAKAAVPASRPGVTAATAPAPASVGAPKNKPAAVLERIETLVPRKQLVNPADPSADLFASPSWSAAPPPAPVAPSAPPVPQAAQIAPPNYRVLGKKLESEVWEVYLGRDDTSFIVRAGDTLEGTWRIDKVEPPSVSMTHVPSGSVHSLPIGDSR
ncbi:MAG TPA: hypothetical protein VFL64_04960 [Rhizobacter sp.]|nr:hypothetical protein [Rhizobacter sp.]